jgi:general secretion pathway protein G
MHVRRFKKAFTLVEILIVVVILGILAAIVVPQFTNASSEAQVSNMESQLQTLRNQVELYRAQHNGSYPDLLASQWAQLTDNTTGNAYLRAAPHNPRTGSDVIVAGDLAASEADHSNGWVFDATTNTIYGCAFHENWRYDNPVGNPWP